MSSGESDRRDRTERQRLIDQAVAADRQGRDRLRGRTDIKVEPSHGDPSRSRDVPNTSPGARP